VAFHSLGSTSHGGKTFMKFLQDGLKYVGRINTRARIQAVTPVPHEVTTGLSIEMPV